jgi:Flp pilus assembly pilin Flp
MQALPVFLRLQHQSEGELLMKTLMINLFRDEQGQDLIEYTLLLAFVALASAALFIGSGTSVSTIWNAASNNLSNAAGATS